MGNACTGYLMKSRVGILTALLLLVAATLDAHDLFLRLDSFFVRPASAVQIRVLNGTFSKSENAITRDRLSDISVVGPSGRINLDTTAWEAKGDASRLNVRTGASGTYLVGASTLPREITLEAKDFNAYLADDGIPDVLAARRRDGELGKRRPSVTRSTSRLCYRRETLDRPGSTRYSAIPPS